MVVDDLWSIPSEKDIGSFLVEFETVTKLRVDEKLRRGLLDFFTAEALHIVPFIFRQEREKSLQDITNTKAIIWVPSKWQSWPATFW